jgi:hypothetical protein
MFECEAKEGSCELELDFEFCVSKAILTFYSIILITPVSASQRTQFTFIRNTNLFDQKKKSADRNK